VNNQNSMISTVQALKVDHTKLITQTAYAKMKCITPQRVNQLVKAKELKTITIKGGLTLIVLD